MAEWVWVNRESGEMRAARCGRLKCPYCVVLEAQSVARAIAMAQPERAVRLSLVGDTWPERRARIKRVRYRIRQAGYEWHDCYHVEPNPRGTGHHAHLWQHGEYVPQAELQRFCLREGLGYPHIERVRTLGRSASYGLKAALGYGLKGVNDGAEVYLQANGGRLVHASSGFWRDLDGSRIRGIRGAVRTARIHAFGPSDGDWILQRRAA